MKKWGGIGWGAWGLGWGSGAYKWGLTDPDVYKKRETGVARKRMRQQKWVLKKRPTANNLLLSSLTLVVFL